MAQTRRPRSVLDSLGEEIVRIIAPVSLCMFLVVILVSILNTSSSSSAPINSIATIAYIETSTDSSWDKFVGALLNSLAFVVAITVATFVLVLLFYFRCTKFLKLYMGFSSFLVLGFFGSEISIFLIEHFSVPIDCITFFLVSLNFAVVGVLAVFMSKMAIIVTQGYLVLIGMLVAYWFTMLPEWTTWALLVAMALYDLAAVLLPIGPLRLLLELAISRDEEIPALVYEARPVNYDNLDPRDGVTQRRVWRERGIENSILQTDSNRSVNSVLGSSLNAESNYNLNENTFFNSKLDSKLVYEARPVNYDNLDPRDGVTQRRVWRERGIENSILQTDSNRSVNSVLGSSLNAESNYNLNENTFFNSKLDSKLVYEAKPVNYDNLDPRDGVTQRRVWRERGIENSILQTDSNRSVNSVLGSSLNAESNYNLNENTFFNSKLNGNTSDGTHDDANLVVENAISNSIFNSNTSYGICCDRNLVRAEEGQVEQTDSELSAPLIDHGMNVQFNRAEDAVSNESLMLEGIGLASSGAIKLGLGDFIFYSVLVGRAAMYDFMTVYACYLAIIAGLGITLMLLALYQKALPALPVSVALGVLFYFLTRLLLEVFVVQYSLNLLMF